MIASQLAISSLLMFDTIRNNTTDLHLHTTCSDGTLTPLQTVTEARQRGLSLIAIADHDTIDGLAPAVQAAVGTGLRILSAIELNTDYKGEEVHILGYGLDPGAAALQEALKKMREGRAGRNLAILARLKDLGMTLEREQVEAMARGKIIARPHIAKAMVQAGHVGSAQEAFDRFLAKGAAAFIERECLTPQQACQAVTDSGGVAALAHPARIAYKQLVGELLPCGLRALEVYHPDQAARPRRELEAFARAQGLLITGGSDSHGPLSARPVAMGSVRIPAEVGERLLAALSEAVGYRPITPTLPSPIQGEESARRL